MNRLERLRSAKNFSVYYGYGQEEKLAAFDVAVIEPGGHHAEDIAILQARGTLCIAYISVIEIRPDDSRIRYLAEEDFLHKDGNRIVNELYGNYLADIRSKRWQNMLMHECSRLIEGLGYDGIFLDTIGNVEHPEIIARFGNALISEFALFLSRLKSVYPEHIVIQNNAVERLVCYTSGIIDGICWENPPIGIRRSKLWMEEIISRLNIIKDTDHLKVMVDLESDNRDDIRKLKYFEQLGYLTYMSPPDYLSLDDKIHNSGREDRT